jgi:cystathionine beta-lyase
MDQGFDREIPREGTNSVKWEFVPSEHDPFQLKHTDQFIGEDRMLPMWVADMDFRCPEPVVNALVERAQHGIYGYTAPTADFYQSVVNWMDRRHGWAIKPEWICLTPGVVPALNMLVRTFTSAGDKVLIQPPVYGPFFMAIENNGAELVTNPLIYENQRYRMDLEDLERKVQDPRVKMAILCSPHNPVGRVWTRDELMAFGQICVDNDVLVLSDEIHGDLIYAGHSFTPFADLTPEFAQHSVICTAPSKTFNMAGLQTSCIIIPNDETRSRFKKTLLSNGLFGTNTFGVVALQAAYDEGEAWLERVHAYIEGNFQYLESYLAGHLPQINVVRPEGTYLVWLDCRGLGLNTKALSKWVMEDARIYLEDGIIFGKEGAGFERMNIACPRTVLAEALDRIHRAVTDLQNQRMVNDPE